MKNDIVKNLRAIHSDLKDRLTKLKKEIGSAEADLEAVGRMLQRYEGQTSLPLPSVEDGGSGLHQLGVDSRGAMTLKQHVLAVLRESYPRACRAKEVRRLVVKRGYKSTAKSFEGSMFAMLSNLNKSGDIVKVQTGLYRYKASTEV